MSRMRETAQVVQRIIAALHPEHLAVEGSQILRKGSLATGVIRGGAGGRQFLLVIENLGMTGDANFLEAAHRQGDPITRDFRIIAALRGAPPDIRDVYQISYGTVSSGTCDIMRQMEQIFNLRYENYSMDKRDGTVRFRLSHKDVGFGGWVQQRRN